MKRNLIVLVLATLGFAGCQQYKKGDGDMLYRIHADKEGPNVVAGDFISLDMIEKTEEDSVLYSSYTYENPAMFVMEKPQFQGDIYSALGMLSEGDSATFKVSMDSIVLKTGMPKLKNSKGKYMIFQIKVNKVVQKGQLDDNAFKAKVNEYFTAEVEKSKKNEVAKIKSFIASKSLKPTTTASGLYYVINTQGSGDKALAGDTVLVNYTGSYLTGRVFDTSVPEVAKKERIFNDQRPYTPLKVIVGANQSIAGFDEALMLLPKGTKATLILPSKLAYGAEGTSAIAPYTPLSFDIDIVNIIHAGSVNSSPVPQANAK